MAEARKQTQQATKSTEDELPDSAKTAAMLRRELKQERQAGEMKLWEKQQAEKTKAEKE